jgi:hypothetical protein
VENVVGENLAKRGKKRLRGLRTVFTKEMKNFAKSLIKVEKQREERQRTYIGERINGKKIFEELKRFEEAK